MTTDVDDSLRARQARSVAAELRHAFVRLVAQRGLDAVPLADVAAEAGISERTLYRYYPNREALIQAVHDEDFARFEAQVTSGAGAPDLADPDLVVRTYELFEEHADLMRVGRALRIAGQDHQASANRTEQLRNALGPRVPAEALDQLVGVIRALSGVDAWLRMREPDVALDNRDAGLAVHWAMQVLIRAAAEADGPLEPLDEPW